MMPDWLPPVLKFAGSDVRVDYATLHSVYVRDFVDGSSIVVEGDQVVVNHEPDPATGNEYTHGFTHLVTSGSDRRAIDYGRAAKLPWVRAVLENYKEPEVTAFWAPHPSGRTLYLWLTDYDFVVMLRKLQSKKEAAGGTKIIVTAYDVHPYKRKDLQRTLGRADEIIQ